MNAIAKLAAPAVFAFAALSANAQSIETDYPRAVPSGPVVATFAPVAPVTAESARSENAPYLIQSNSEGPRVDPMYSAANESKLTRKEVQSQVHAQVHVEWYAPDIRS